METLNQAIVNMACKLFKNTLIIYKILLTFLLEIHPGT